MRQGQQLRECVKVGMGSGVRYELHGRSSPRGLAQDHELLDQLGLPHLDLHLSETSARDPPASFVVVRRKDNGITKNVNTLRCAVLCS